MVQPTSSTCLQTSSSSDALTDVLADMPRNPRTFSIDAVAFSRMAPVDTPDVLLSLVHDCTNVYPAQRPSFMHILGRLRSMLSFSHLLSLLRSLYQLGADCLEVHAVTRSKGSDTQVG